MTILRISLIAMISALFIFGGSRGADASARISGYCSEAYSQCAKPCEGKNPTAQAACLKHCKKKYCPKQ
jgi:hypothetical protein